MKCPHCNEEITVQLTKHEMPLCKCWWCGLPRPPLGFSLELSKEQQDILEKHCVGKEERWIKNGEVVTKYVLAHRNHGLCRRCVEVATVILKDAGQPLANPQREPKGGTT